jgi:transcription initiation factor TFIIIB Brf1 subunit/transcription initiation factor TFIIB
MATAAPGVRPEGPAAWRKNLSAHLICPECKEVPPNLEFPDSHETVCGSCGLVLADREIDTHSEWRTFSNDDQNNDDPSRVGDAANPLLNGNQLETQIAAGATGKARELYRAQNKQSSEKTNKALLAAYKEIGALCDGFNIQKNVADTAKYLFKIVDDAKAFKGKSQDVIIAGCIFIACRQCKVPRTFTEIFAVTKVTRKEIGRIYKALEKFFTQQNLERINSVVSNGGKFARPRMVITSFADLVLNMTFSPVKRCPGPERDVHGNYLHQAKRSLQSVLQPAGSTVPGHQRLLSAFGSCDYHGRFGWSISVVDRGCLYLHGVLLDGTRQDSQRDLASGARQRWHHSRRVQTALR